MSNRKNRNRGTKAPGVTPQGYGQDAEFAEEPKSKLENAAKKKNTKQLRLAQACGGCVKNDPKDEAKKFAHFPTGYNIYKTKC